MGKSNKSQQKFTSGLVPFGYIALDREGQIVYANETTKSMFLGLSDKIIGGNIVDFPLQVFDDGQYLPVSMGFLGSRSRLGVLCQFGIEPEKATFFASIYLNRSENGTLSEVILVLEPENKNAPAQNHFADNDYNHTILDAIDDGIMVVDLDSEIKYLNESLTAYIERENLAKISPGTNIFQALDELQIADSLQKSLADVLEEKSNSAEHHFKFSDEKWYSLKMNRLNGDQGVVLSFQDVNTRKQIELALEKSLRKYRNIYNHAPVMMHSVGRDKKIVSVSDFWLEKMGYDRNEIIGKSPKYFIANSHHKVFDQSISELFDKGEVKNVLYKFVKKDGELIDVVLSAAAEYDEDGEFDASIAGMIDISEQKKVEERLSENSAKLIEAQRISKIGNFEIDLHSGICNASNESRLMLGIGDILLQDLALAKEVIHPADFPQVSKQFAEHFQKKEDFLFVCRILHYQTQNLKWVSVRGKFELSLEGVAEKVIGTIQDITGQQEAEDKIKRLSDRILLSTEIASLGVWEYDAELRQIFWEDQMYKIFPDAEAPYNFEQLKGMVPEGSYPQLKEIIKSIKGGASFVESELALMIQGKLTYLKSFTRVLGVRDGMPIRMVGVVYDITEDKEFQTQLESSLEEKNVLIREVHHRVKNNMQLISSIMALKAYDLNDDQAKLIFEDINTRIKAMSVIYDKLHRFYNVSEIEIQDFLNQVIKELGILLGIKTITLEIDVESKLLDIDKALVLGLIVSEMVSNAIKHSFTNTDTGTINISFKKYLDEKYCLSVTNSGKRIPGDVLSSSQGIGMSMIKTFVRQLKAELTLDDKNGFKVTF
ncbi:MAG: PAS domain S-box protein [Bacteroidota bacterium]